MNKGKLFSGLMALAIYLGLIFLVLYFYNIHETKAKNYVEKESNRVTVTLVNSDKTVFNKSSKVSTPNKPTPVLVPPVHIKRPESVSKKVATPKIIPKKRVVKKVIKPKHVPKKVVPKKVVRPKPVPKKSIPKKVVPKKVAPKKVVPKKVVPKKSIPKKVVPKKPKPKKSVPKKVVPKKTAKDLFSSVKTKDVSKQPVKREPKTVKRPVVVPKAPSRIKHNSSISDRIKNTHQSGRVSNKNREVGVKNAYIARVKRHMNNWNAGSAYKGKRVSLALTIYSSGKFSYRILSGADSSMRHSLSQFLDQLNRMGQLGKHSKSSPYSIRVDFTVR
jgi:hypothetical protein